jgi:trafficking protein particle complex subunit 8
MQPFDHGAPSESLPSLPTAASTLRLPKKRQNLDEHSMSQSEASLPSRRANPSAASLYASTLTPPGSRSISPTRTASPARPLSSSGPAGASFTRSLLESPAADNPGDPLSLLLKAFVPHVAIYSSPDTDALAKDKGFVKGLWELLRPFGERVQGKVTVRDSNGAARFWEDFSLRFVKYGAGIEQPEPANGGVKGVAAETATNGAAARARPGSREAASTANKIAQVEAVVSRHLQYAEESFVGLAQPSTPTRHGLDVDANSAYYALYLRRLLSGMPVACHETFAHPVASVIVVSSRNPSPIQAFRELYRDTNQGAKKLPIWVDSDYLRYYVLVHDEETGDIAQSMALFEQMKRHLGLHCHLLRLRSSQSAETDDDSIPLPRSDWMTAAEELEEIEKSDSHDDFEDPTRYIFESDATAIRAFVREMTIQSIVPTMERNMSMWNDQVASKRKGISGRFMSLSKRWGAFGGSRNTSSGAGSSSSNYDLQGFYSAEMPEAIMRKLADYAFMLRDWKLAMSTYDILRADFANDKAWKYHAAANEMAAVALLIMPTSMSSRTKLETISSMLEQAFYSYHTRCSSSYGAVRCIALAMDLMRLRGGPAIDDGVKWGLRLQEVRLTGPVGDALMKERMAVCCATKQGVGSMKWGSWRRKSAFWSILAADSWIQLSKYIQAQRCLNEARMMYSSLGNDEGISGFALASDFMAQLQQKLKAGLTADGFHTEAVVEEEPEVEVLADEDMDKLSKRRSRRASVIGVSSSVASSLETAPLRKLSTAGQEEDGEASDNAFG